MLSSNLPSMQSAADQFISAAREQCQKIFVPNERTEEKEALIVDDEQDEDLTISSDNTQITSADTTDLFSADQDMQCYADDMSTTATTINDTQMIESIGFPSHIIPDATSNDVEENDKVNDGEEVLLNFD